MRQLGAEEKCIQRPVIQIYACKRVRSYVREIVRSLAIQGEGQPVGRVWQLQPGREGGRRSAGTGGGRASAEARATSGRCHQARSHAGEVSQRCRRYEERYGTQPPPTTSRFGFKGMPN